MTSLPDLDQMPPEQLRTLDARLMSKVDSPRRQNHAGNPSVRRCRHGSRAL